MFPIRDHNPSRHPAYVTWGLMAVNIIVFMMYVPLLGDEIALSTFFDNWAMVPAEITSGSDYHTALTSMFLHGGFMHIAGNMLFLWIFGDNVEDAMGHIPFLAFYLAAGFAADAIHVLSDPNSPIPTVGASGAIAGVMGAYLLLYPNAKVDILIILVVIFRIFTLPAFIVLGVWMAMQLFGGVASSAAGGGVAYWAHVGGFIAGVILTLPLWAKRGGVQFWKRSDYHPPHKPTFETRSTTIPVVRRRK
ncbi:rhomboid family intramembrane serine protease [Amylibacter ulvae]|uniref:Rhomboid family intramembrane serine protease n=1 Tax=Paramylibacter ulvae TaxID=1651968 RepID=A0ABQ3D6M4_9RHOB|nr:rhomboid family intramembrane serine protease [Amylibacter ulvae]GHA52618.1 rhomboid family intramembrane serine protease [Amylibacter ulvae]